MRARWAIVAAGLGIAASAGWMAVHQRSHPGPPAVQPPHRDDRVGLMVRHAGPALYLYWNPRQAQIAAAQHGILTITDGTHRSRLDLDPGELRAGLASYWPESTHVNFRLETDSGASGSVDVPVEAPPEPAPPLPGRRFHTELGTVRPITRAQIE
jgi:hypothetical protein